MEPSRADDPPGPGAAGAPGSSAATTSGVVPPDAAPPGVAPGQARVADLQLRCQAALRPVPGVVRAQPPLRQGLVALAGTERREPFPLSAFRLAGRPGAWVLELRLVVSQSHLPVEVVTAAERALLGVLGAGARVRLSVVDVVG